MSECPHELWEREAACADGYCPICLAQRVAVAPVASEEVEATCERLMNAGTEDLQGYAAVELGQLLGEAEELIRKLDAERAK